MKIQIDPNKFLNENKPDISMSLYSAGHNGNHYDAKGVDLKGLAKQFEKIMDDAKDKAESVYRKAFMGKEIVVDHSFPDKLQKVVNVDVFYSEGVYEVQLMTRIDGDKSPHYVTFNV